MAGGWYIGIDVSKDSLEVAFGCDGEVRQVSNADRAIMALAAELKELGPQLVVMEASGGYERMVAALLWEADLPVVVANPSQVRDFAKGLGQYAKTDRQQRLAQTVSKPIRKELNASIGSLRRRLERIEAEIEQRIRKSELWNRTRELLESVPGVGKLTSFMLLAELPELGTSDRRRLASLVGVAPYPRDSGKWHRPRLTYGGRAAVRSALYMAALSAARCNPVLAPFSAGCSVFSMRSCAIAFLGGYHAPFPSESASGLSTSP